MKKKIILISVIVILTIGALTVWWFLFGGSPYVPPEESADQRFGFLGSPMPGDYKWIRDTGAGWVRPHPGPFIWGKMQKSQDDKINFSDTDSVVKNATKYDLNLLITLWPYAVWDQRNHKDVAQCKVTGEEFKGEFGMYRCNPQNWEAYRAWVRAVVERYDGDGVDDMPGLVKPVIYWEAFNEPDLQGGPEGGLQFYVEGPAGYAKLLKQTKQAIDSADTNAKVLIAGAAGGNDQFLDYYREVFKDNTIRGSFDNPRDKPQCLALGNQSATKAMARRI